MNRRPLPALIAGLALSAALAGCAGGGGTSPTSAADQTRPPEAVTQVTNMPGSVQGYEGAAADATTTACERSGDGWRIAGTVTNSAAEPREYRIYASLLNGGDTRGLQEIQVPVVEPGATADWEATIPVAEDGLQCVLRVERFAPAGAAGEPTETP